MSHRVNRTRASRWAVHDRWLRSQVPESARGWLLDAGSLTDRLRESCKGCFSVRVLDEGWQRPRLDEARVLGMRQAAVGWVREVQLLCGGEPQVFARTIVPRKTLSGARRQLAHLGDRPLGAYLFADPSLQRSAVELACICPGQAMFAEATEGLQRRPLFIWGRRSVFRIGGKPLLVTEVFLPAVARMS